MLAERAQVADAAILAGYSSPSHYIRDFRRRFGVTPGQLRDASLRV
jgi:AraC-like DNA-binding protein